MLGVEVRVEGLLCFDGFGLSALQDSGFRGDGLVAFLFAFVSVFRTGSLRLLRLEFKPWALRVSGPSRANLKGPRTQINKVVYYSLNGIWALKRKYWGPWIHRERADVCLGSTFPETKPLNNACSSPN